MKKLIALFALLLAALALVACGGGSSSTEAETGAAGVVEEAEEGAEEAGEKAEEVGEEAKEKGEEAKNEAEGGNAGSGATVEVEADPSGNLAFTSDNITAKAGKDTINFTNSSPVPHDVHIEDSSGKEIGGTEIVSEGADSAEVELKPGTYTYFCSVPGHRQAGMEGTLTVK
ncbi:MAG TPA: plastocyanin/azurin family copper-binding protein [Solirubrobacterales bacterium]|nr:plastocyanin/azurin family copper-binding protein [Solirubrobacterales bacterium]